MLEKKQLSTNNGQVVLLCCIKTFITQLKKLQTLSSLCKEADGLSGSDLCFQTFSNSHRAMKDLCPLYSIKLTSAGKLLVLRWFLCPNSNGLKAESTVKQEEN